MDFNTFDLNFDGKTDELEQLTEYRLVTGDFPEKENESESDFDWLSLNMD